MKIITTKQFNKQYSKLNKKQKIQIKNTVTKFKINPYDLSLRNHKLAGKLKNFRSISAANDLRIVFDEKESYCTVILIAVGTHNQVY